MSNKKSYQVAFAHVTKDGAFNSGSDMSYGIHVDFAAFGSGLPEYVSKYTDLGFDEVPGWFTSLWEFGTQWSPDIIGFDLLVCDESEDDSPQDLDATLDFEVVLSVRADYKIGKYREDECGNLDKPVDFYVPKIVDNKIGATVTDAQLLASAEALLKANAASHKRAKTA